ncbi:MAG: type I methionyl aminopeptidase [Spirochaetales bacterium]|nr:type I methionyl aminopeptidase [Spirochaetales bacterium]
MIQIKTEDEIRAIKASGQICARTLAEVGKRIKDGITTKELDDFARNYIQDRGGIPAFLGYMDYPATLCISVNNEVIHGIPGKRRLKQGDIVGVDLGVNLKGFFSDSCVTFPVGKVSEARQKLLKVTEECLVLAIQQAKMGNRISDISRAVYTHSKANGYDVVRNYCGHGVGFEPHEDPQVYNYVCSGANPRLKPGMVLAIEPMVNEGTHRVNVLSDGWTVVTEDGRDSAHFEHTVAILNDRTEILTLIE